MQAPSPDLGNPFDTQLPVVGELRIPQPSPRQETRLSAQDRGPTAPPPAPNLAELLSRHDERQRRRIVAQAIRTLMDRRGSKQIDLVQAMAADKSVVSRIYHGQRAPTLEQYLAIMAALGLEPEDLWTQVRALMGDAEAERVLDRRVAGQGLVRAAAMEAVEVLQKEQWVQRAMVTQLVELANAIAEAQAPYLVRERSETEVRDETEAGALRTRGKLPDRKASTRPSTKTGGGPDES